MKWFFQPRPDPDESGRDHDDSPPGSIGLSAAVLQRHGALVLDPAKAALVNDDQPPRPTVYRARTLLLPDDLAADDRFMGFVDAALARVGLKLVPQVQVRQPLDAGRDGGKGDGDAASGDGDAASGDAIGRDGDRGKGDGDVAGRDVAGLLRRLPRPAVLVPLPDYPTPVVVDAWVALQTLRAAARPQHDPEPHKDPEPLEDPEPHKDPGPHEDPGPYTAAVDRISLEHLLTTSAIGGSPISNWGGGISGGPGSTSDSTGPSPTDSYLYSGGDPRTPIAVFFDPPARKSDEDCVRDYGRRPVVAVLDTGARAHTWLDVQANSSGGYDTEPGGFVAVDDEIQAAIFAESQFAANHGDRHRRLIKDPWDTPVTADPLAGELNPALGHCTFISGIVRQKAPEARVLAVRIMHSDDVAYEGDIICALRQLAERIALGEPDDLAATVDVVSLSFGYFSESRHHAHATSHLWKVLEVLLDLGVVVVAAAGNYANRRKFYPAAFAEHAVPADQVPVISVGALNPNGSKAIFSNDGPWVTAWALGAAVVSTYPEDVNGSRSPELRIPANLAPPGVSPPERDALDPDDYSAGWASWSGTSFSAPYLASLIVGSLLEGAAKKESGLQLGSAGGQAATVKRRERAVAAVKNLQSKAHRDG
jgi:hypothetical protein